MAFSSRLKARPDEPEESFDSLTRRQEATFDARRKAAEDEARRAEYEAEKARQTKSGKPNGARRATRSTGSGIGNPEAFAGYPQRSQPSQGFTWKKGSEVQEPRKGLSFGGTLKSAAPTEKSSSRPDHDACEQAISAMISRTYNGMKEGLQMLGLPDYPLSFAPGRELKLCGHHIREEINEMIHHWMTDEKEDFYAALAKIKAIVSKPILTQEELDLVDAKDDWQKTIGPDGQAQYTRRQDGVSLSVAEAAEDDDDDDEVIDIAPDGTRLNGRAAGAMAKPECDEEELLIQTGTPTLYPGLLWPPRSVFNLVFARGWKLGM
ncbi:unnamed protein product [Durusdinium trenchii]|uniref:Uncharacterized protein n=2 Tax=Durusdinium trenchii TaxID=1381693 RepID=A0ABP0KXC8_9DINO